MNKPKTVKKKLKKSSNKNYGKYLVCLLKKETPTGGGMETVFRVEKALASKTEIIATLDTLITGRRKKTTTPRTIAICNADNVIIMEEQKFNNGILLWSGKDLERKELGSLFVRSQNTGRTRRSKKRLENTKKR